MSDFLGKVTGFALLAGFFFGLFVVVVAPFEMWKKADAETWPSRRGVITVSYALRHPGSAGRHSGGAYWTAEICGKYKDNGEKFCVSRVRFGGFRFGEGKDDASEDVRRYPIGSEVDVHYSTDNPAETVLEAKSSWTTMFILLGLGIAGVLLPVVLWVFRRQIEPERYRRE